MGIKEDITIMALMAQSGNLNNGYVVFRDQQILYLVVWGKWKVGWGGVGGGG